MPKCVSVCTIDSFLGHGIEKVKELVRRTISRAAPIGNGAALSLRGVAGARRCLMLLAKEIEETLGTTVQGARRLIASNVLGLGLRHADPDTAMHTVYHCVATIEQS